MALGHPAVAGLIEERGTGLLAVPHEAAAVVRCIVDLAGKPGDLAATRMPESIDQRASVGGIELPRIQLLASLTAQESARRILCHLALERGS
jgi:hypothetical protein